MSIHHRPIAERIEWLLALAHRHTSEFRSPEACLARELYLAKHPTAIIVLKCMDGRINIPVATGTPPGIIQPIRNLGGMFNLGWPHLGEVLAHHVLRMTSSGRRVLVLALSVSLLGGGLIGLAAAIMLLGVGRIAGVSGIAAKAAPRSPSSCPASCGNPSTPT